MTAASLTWLGHASFRLDSPGGKRIYVDPWFDNPKCPANEKDPERCDAIAVTHGHSDHVGSVVAITEKLGPMPIVAMIELKDWLKGQNVWFKDVETEGAHTWSVWRRNLTEAAPLRRPVQA